MPRLARRPTSRPCRAASASRSPGRGALAGLWHPARGALAASLLASALLAPAAATASAASVSDGAWSFVSQPSLSPPAIETPVPAAAPASTSGGASAASAQGPGYIFLAPIKNYSIPHAFIGKPGPEIVEANGTPVWEHPLGEPITVGSTRHETVGMDFHEATYERQPVLVWWQGYITPEGLGNGVWEIVDQHYRTLATVHAPRGYDLDFHEIAITGRGYAYVLGNRVVHLSLHCCNGPANGSLNDQVMFEVDIKTGRIVWKWDPLQHIHLRDSYTTPSGTSAWDPYHINSIAFGPGGAPIVSMRNTWAAYWLDRNSGRVFATLGGKHSSFKLGPGVRFAWQHDVSQRADEHLSLFDDEAAPVEGKQSRGELIALDWRHHTATLTSQFLLPHPALAGSQGNMQQEPGGNYFVGFGQLPYFGEYNSQGGLLFLGKLPGPDESYRTYRYPWTGTPAEEPALSATPAGGGATAYASWNGATDVAAWQLLTGANASHLGSAGPPVARTGFETEIQTHAAGPSYAVQALDASGHVLATSATVSISPSHKTTSSGKSSRKGA